MERFKYQNKKDKNYFEGWYFRFTTNNMNYAVIFAVTKNETDPHSFVQVFDENDEECLYLRYDVDMFKYCEESDSVSIDKHYLSPVDMYVESEKLTLKLKFDSLVKLADFEGSDSAMSYLKNAPLQCFQEVIYLGGKATGTLNEEEVNGDIYIEKTYGNSFPSRWIWIQSSHSKKGNLISFSVGKIPILFFKVNGFFCLLKVKGELIRFASPLFSRIKIKGNRIIIKSFTKRLELYPKGKKTVNLVGPIKNGEMKSVVKESINSQLSIKLYDKGKLVVADEFTNVGLELMY